MSATQFRVELETLINCQSMENGSDTPDFILADYLVDCLAAYDRALQVREKWYGRAPKGIIYPYGPDGPAVAASKDNIVHDFEGNIGPS